MYVIKQYMDPSKKISTYAWCAGQPQENLRKIIYRTDLALC